MGDTKRRWKDIIPLPLHTKLLDAVVINEPHIMAAVVISSTRPIFGATVKRERLAQ